MERKRIEKCTVSKGDIKETVTYDYETGAKEIKYANGTTILEVQSVKVYEKQKERFAKRCETNGWIFEVQIL